MLKTGDHDGIPKASVLDSRPSKDEEFGSQRVYKKTSPNSMLTLYLGSRDIICRQEKVEPLRGIILVDPKYVASHKIYGQLTLTFRYGREDEEVMGLKFCNEAIIALKQIWPISKENEPLSPLQQALIERLGKTAYPFTIDVASLAPPSVQLVPAKRYTGAPIGTSYDVRVHLADHGAEDRVTRRSMVRLGVRVIHKITSEAKAQPIIEPDPPTLSKSLRLRLSPKALKLANKFSTSVDENQHRELNGQRSGISCIGSMSRIDIEKHSTNPDVKQSTFFASKGPEGCVDKPFLWTEGRVSLRAALDKSAYVHGEQICVTIDVRNESRKIIRKIRVFAVQHVDVCMFSNGKFKNVVAEFNESYQIKPNETYRKEYSLVPMKGPTKNWIAVEGSHSTSNGSHTAPLSLPTTEPISTSEQPDPTDNMIIASSAPRGPQTFEERNVFAIYVSYYIKVKLTLNGMGGEVSLKLPFILGHLDDDPETDGDNLQTKGFHRSKGPAEIFEEECGHDEITGANDDINATHNANQCDIIQLQEKFSHIQANTDSNTDNNNSVATNHTDSENDGDDDDDDDDDECDANATNKSCQNIITAQIHHANLSQPPTTPPFQTHSTEHTTDC